MHILDKLPENKTSSKLVKLDVHNYWDLALHIPLRYEDMTKVYSISEVQIGQQVMIEGTILSHEITHKRSRQLLVKLNDGQHEITLIFFHFYPNYTTQFALGKLIRAHGEVKADFSGRKIMFHPKIQTVKQETQLSNTFTPIYPTTNGLSNVQIIALVDELFEAELIFETLPSEILRKYKLLGFTQALLALHKLTPEQFIKNYHKQALLRLKFDELIAQQLLMHKIYLKYQQNSSPILVSTKQILHTFLKQLPFKLTHAQQKVIKEILSDLGRHIQMNRLLQGDVGSGKTIVATIAAIVALENNYQVCFMAPTEILAAQHYNKIAPLLEPLGVKVVWLSGSLTVAKKREIQLQISSHDAQLIIGTHAVFQKNVVFAKLGLVIIDEQHRFGVEQRRALIDKKSGNLFPHQLMMSATPIPRSLAMSYYADLDVSDIDELPQGRMPIKTLLVNNSRRGEVIEFVLRELVAGRQIYWVCPLIEESETLDLETAINTYNELCQIFRQYKVGLVHGRINPREKSQIMEQFNHNQIQILVATTVIEVGVDVANASVMVIEHSERMGLAQLHQLRGRVGRGKYESTCILLYAPNLSELSGRRLKVIASNNDGFEIARQDLLMRGPGELLGQRQSGLPALRFASLEEDLPMLTAAQQIARDLVETHPTMAQQLVALWFHNRQVYSDI